MQLSKNKRQETLVYLVLWGLIFIAPVMSMYIRAHNGQSFEWSEVFVVWRQYAVFFVIFLIHNHLLAPLLVYKQRKALYFSIVAVLVALFTVYQCNTRPAGMPKGGPRHEMMSERRPPMPDDRRPPKPPFPPEFHQKNQPPPRPHGERQPPLIFGQRDLVAIVVLILMLFANLGIKLYFKQRRDQLQIAELEKKNLEQQLEYLKYQLNPHFLMNTLNNIHALVDIEPERSKEAIIQLSKILRYVLYESNKERVPMSEEVEFMNNYIRLMRIRYTDRLRFSANVPEDVAGVSIPPLLFISFVENAFKHGVSYQKDSFIDISGKRYKDIDGKDRLLWTCRNSKHPKPDTSPDSNQGVGLANVRQRLNLIFGDHYSLNVNDTDNTYEVKLDIPLEE